MAAEHITPDGAAASVKWATLPYRRQWLLDQASRLFDFFERHSIDPSGGFFSLALANDVGSALGIELDPQAIFEAEASAKENTIENVRYRAEAGGKPRNHLKMMQV